MEQLDKEKALKHFKEFYQKILFLDQEVGTKEQTYKTNEYITDYISDDKRPVLAFVKEQTEVDEEIFFRKNGIILKLKYGGWYNIKYGELEVTIEKDPYYQGKIGHISDVLTLLNNYLENNYKKYDERINKVIYGENNTNLQVVKYRPSNILSKNKIKSISINGLKITDEDIAALSFYPNINVLSTSKCEYLVSNLHGLNVIFYKDSKSLIPSLDIFNNVNIANISLYMTALKEDLGKNLTLRLDSLYLTAIKMNYELFFLKTNFINLKNVGIDEIMLSPIEIELLRVFTQAKEMEASGEANSLDFLDYLVELRKFRGKIILPDEYIHHLRGSDTKLEELFKDKSGDFIKNYLVNRILFHLDDKNRFLARIKVPKVALTKWEGIINNATEEEIKRKIAYYNSLPLSARQKIATEDCVEFVDVNLHERYKLLGINLLSLEKDDTYTTTIIGPFGYNLYRHKQYFYETKIPILGTNGKIIEEISFCNERDVTIPEHYIETKDIIVANKDNVFDYYYNHQLKNSDKVQYLKSVLETNPFLFDLKGYYDENKNNNALIAELDNLYKKRDSFKDIIGYLYSSPEYIIEEVESEFNGEKYLSHKFSLDEYTSKEDHNIYCTLDRHRTVASIMRTLDACFTEEKRSEQEKTYVLKRIEEFIDVLNQIDDVKQQIIDYSLIIERNLPNKYRIIIDELALNDYTTWYIADINRFLEKYNLNILEYNFFFNYVLLKQSERMLQIDALLEDIEDRLMILDRVYNVCSLNDYLFSDCGFESLEEAYQKGACTLESLEKASEYDKLLDHEEELNQIYSRVSEERFKCYLELIPEIEKLSFDQLATIKANMIITDIVEDTFFKFVDYLYYYIKGEYPYWITTELLKAPALPEQYKNTIIRELKEECKQHIYSYRKIT